MIEIRAVTHDEFPEMRRAVNRGFGHDLPADDTEGLAGARAIFELDRTYCAFDEGLIVGTCADFALNVAVPGGVQPMAGTTVVVVQPTHRRRGLLTQMMRAHMDATHERGEPLAGLWASETVIYGRFGFGSATDRLDLAFDTRRIGPWTDRGLDTIEFVESADADSVVRSFFEEWYPTQPGALSRSDAWWTHRVMRDPESRREGGSALRFAIARRDDRVVGYCTYRQTEKFEDWIAEGTVDVVDLFGLDGQARSSLWRYVAHIDLFPHVRYWNAPVDVGLPWQVANLRAIKRSVSDGLWLRLVDVEKAFDGRSFAVSDSVTVEVVDEFCEWNAGTYRIEADGGSGGAVRTSDAPHLTMDIGTLSAMFLGGRNPVNLLDSGLASGERTAAARLGAMLATDAAPWCQDVF